MALNNPGGFFQFEPIVDMHAERCCGHDKCHHPIGRRATQQCHDEDGLPDDIAKWPWFSPWRFDIVTVQGPQCQKKDGLQRVHTGHRQQGSQVLHGWHGVFAILDKLRTGQCTADCAKQDIRNRPG